VGELGVGVGGQEALHAVERLAVDGAVAAGEDAAVVAEDAVLAGAAGDPVVTVAADQVVVLAVAVEDVLALLAVGEVVAGLAVDLVVAADVEGGRGGVEVGPAGRVIHEGG